MSEIGQKPLLETAMKTATRENHLPSGLGSGSGTACPHAAARLQAIHDLIRAGDYHVPATAIADRMIERMIADKRRRNC
jgi:anti-sigma28 factor (negative regulator of flagellin synthesis)